MKQVIFLLFIMATLFSCHHKNKQTEKQFAYPKRILSLAPSITETIFLLGKGSSIVGVSDFCTWPDSVKHITHVGGYLNPNFEAILALKPDIVFILKEQSKVLDFCVAQKIHCVKIDDQNLGAVAASLKIIGKCLGVESRGDSLAKNMLASLMPDTIFPKPKILLTIGRDGAGSGLVSSCWVPSNGTFYGELLKCAGATNCILDTGANYATISSESIMRLQPDIIIDLMPSMQQYKNMEETLKKDWSIYSMTPAVKNGMVFMIKAEYATIPSPRIILFLKDLREIVANWRSKN